MQIIPLLLSIFIVGLCYLIGSIPFAVVVSRFMGLQDPRKFGSKNPGATNVLRTGNKTAALLTLVGDAGKGWAAVALAIWLSNQQGLTHLVVALSGLAVFLGHVYPVFLKFKGGKGVATALGVLLGFNVWLALATALTWLIIAYAFKYSSLAAIIAAIFAPLYYVLGSNVAWVLQPSYASAIVAISVLLLLRHKTNISKLLQGKESRIGQNKQNALNQTNTRSKPNKRPK